MVAGTSAFQKSVVRLESFLGERIIDVINSTDLRAVGVDVREIGLFPVEAGFNDPDALITYRMGAQS